MRSSRRFLVALLIVIAVVAGACTRQTKEKGTKVNESIDGAVLKALAASKSVLWIASHPDDENSSGALVARAKDVAGKLYMVSLTRGENSDIVWGGLKRGSQMGEARGELFAQAAKLFQADGFELGPFVNGPHTIKELDARPANAPHADWPPRETHSDDVIEKWKKEGDPVAYITGILRRWRPNTIISMDDWCGVSGHDEHMAATRLILQSVPVAADRSKFLQAGEPWQVENVIFTAHVIKMLKDIDYKKCEGEEPTEPIEQVSAVDQSKTHGMTYFGAACRVSRNYMNTMTGRGWSEAQMKPECEEAEGRAKKAFAAGNRDFPLLEPYRMRPLQS